MLTQHSLVLQSELGSALALKEEQRHKAHKGVQMQAAGCYRDDESETCHFRARFQALRHSWAVARDQLEARAAAAVAADEAREKLDADLEMQRIM